MILNTNDSPFIMVIFGATGDLARHKLIPSLFSLFQKGQLPENFYVYGFARRDLSVKEFADLFEEAKMNDRWDDFAKHLYYQQGLFNEENGYKELTQKLQNIDTQMGACVMRLFYLATPPENYEQILDMIKDTNLDKCGFLFAASDAASKGQARIAIEKPFGKDLATARELDRKLANIFEENQIFRVDHYLGKETVQNILVFRFANSIFEPVWNNEFIDHIQITFAEKKGIEDRGKFFDGVGMLRDVGQNHLMQLLASVAMEQPKSFSKEGVREARAQVLKALECINPEKIDEEVVRGQYAGYFDEEDASPNSTTETFVAFKTFVNTPRFQGVPFYIRAGKEMAQNHVSISVIFKQTCHLLFREIGCPEEGNILTFHIQPDEGITLHTIAKKPGAGDRMELGDVDMKFFYQEAFGTKGADAYEKILLDIISGDQMLFNRSDELEYSWTFIEKILEGWNTKNTPLITYSPGESGPKEADQLLVKDSRKWL